MAFAQAPALFLGSGGSGPAGLLYAKKRIIPVGEYTEYAEWQESTVTDRAGLYALVQAVEPDIPLSAIMMDRFLIGGGGGATGGDGAFGGMPAFVARDTIALSAFKPDSTIHIQIGAGGSGSYVDLGLQGSDTSIYEYDSNNSFIGGTDIIAPGGMPGASNVDTMKVFYRDYIEMGILMSDPLAKLDGQAAGSRTNPGCGAWYEADSYIFGGVGSRGENNPFYQCGNGGVSDVGIGDAGFLGGGGGASAHGTRGGDGGNGVARILFWVMEIVG